MLLDVRNAQNRLLEVFFPIGSEKVALEEAAGRVLSEDIHSSLDLPPFTNSSMDGFALRAEDVRSASENDPVTLKVVADIPAGSVSEVTLQSAQAARIMTGAPLPPGADAVIPVEDTDVKVRPAGTPVPDLVKVFRPVSKGDYLRRRGTDLRAGEAVLSSGKRLRPRDIGMLAMLGIAAVPVYQRPNIGLLSTGDELLSLEQPLSPGKIYETNGFTLAALIIEAGGVVHRLGIAPDREAAVQERLDRAVDLGVDLIISSAGVSVGAYDFVRKVVQSHGELNFWRVNMRPGKPIAFGSYRQIPFVGLPGNPVSSFAGFEVFIRPVIKKMAGESTWRRQTLRGILLDAVTSDGRESYLRATIERKDHRLGARLTGHQGSGNLFSLVQADALVIIPAGVKSLPVGSEVDIWPL